MTKRSDIYADMKGREWNLTALDDEERQLAASLQTRVKSHPDWNDFDTFWMRKVSSFYDRRGLSRKK
jgi:hypothetical protein